MISAGTAVTAFFSTVFMLLATRRFPVTIEVALPLMSVYVLAFVLFKLAADRVTAIPRNAILSHKEREFQEYIRSSDNWALLIGFHSTVAFVFIFVT